MRVKFYLKRPIPGKKAIRNAKKLGKELPEVDPLSPTSIFALAHYNAETIKIYTGECIAPKYWNKSAQQARTTPSFPEAPEFNQRLDNIRSTINKTYLNYKNNNDHKEPSVELLKPLIESALNKKVVSTSFFSFFQDFAIKTVSGSRIDPRSKKAIKGSGGRGYLTTLNKLREFELSWGRKLTFEAIDLDFYSDFTKFLTTKPLSLSLNSVGSHIQRLKAVMSEAVEKRLTTNTIFKSKRFVKPSEDSDSIYLNEAELKQIKALNLKDNPRLDNIRDLFLIGCYTGLRFSDYSILKPQNINDGFIKIKQVKTGSPIVIPVHSVVKKILEKHKGKLPKSISNVKTNEYLKEIAEMAPLLKEIVSKEITKGGSQITQMREKWELVTSHTARRSFATNEYKAGTQTLMIMAITGHKTEKSFLKYIRVTPDEHAIKLKALWDRRSKLKAV